MKLPEKKTHNLIRTENRLIGGVCSAMGTKFGISPTLIRIAFVILSIFFAFPIIIYFIIWFILPTNKSISQQTTNSSSLWIGGILGGITGAILGFYIPIFLLGFMNGLLLIFTGFIGLLVGILSGIGIGRSYSEKTNQNF